MRKYRRYPFQLKMEVIRLLNGGTPISVLCEKYQLSDQLVRFWKNSWIKGLLVEKKNFRTLELKALEKENQQLKEKLAELYLEMDLLKKVVPWLQRKKSISSSTITSSNWARYKEDVE